MKLVRPWFFCILSLSLLACTPRPSKVATLQSEASTTSGDLTESPSAQSEVSDERVSELEKSLAETSAAASTSDQEAKMKVLDEQLQTMTAQMANTESMGAQEKVDLQAQIDGAEQEKAAIEQQVAAIKGNDAENQKVIAALKAEIEQLKKQLAATKAGQTVAPTKPAATAAGFFKFYYTGNKCLDVQGSSTAENAPILGFTCLQKNLNQQYAYEVRGNYFFLKSRSSNKCVASTNTQVASPVVQKTCTNNSDKAWQWFGVKGATGKLRNLYSGKCLGVNTGRIVQSECNSVFAINFSFFKAP